MNGTIFGIGPLEVIVIMVLTLLIFGPERLPEMMRGVGNALRKLRLTYIAFTSEFQGELKPIAEDIDSVTREIRQEVDAIREAADIRSLLKPYADDVNKAVKLQPISPAAPACDCRNSHRRHGGQRQQVRRQHHFPAICNQQAGGKRQWQKHCGQKLRDAVHSPRHQTAR